MIKKLLNLYTLSERKLFDRVMKIHPENIHKKGSYIYINNGSNIVLVSHLDKVNRVPLLKDIIVNDNKISCYDTSLGADDRTGVFIVLEMLKKYKVSALLTCQEEKGGIGVKQFIKDDIFNTAGVECFIELDRQGVNEFVQYDIYKNLYDFDFDYNKFFNDNIKDDSIILDDKDIIDCITDDMGLVEGYGSYSDVADLTNHYNIPHMNLGVGYYNEHTVNEYQSISGLLHTMYLLDVILTKYLKKVK